jgi:hypothetical protein
MNKQTLRTTLLFSAALLMGFAAVVSATVSVPHLQEDLVEIEVRRTLLRTVLLGLHFGTFAMFGFACLVFAAAVQSLRSLALARLPLMITSAAYIGFGVLAFAWTGSHHTLGYVLMGLLIFVALLIPEDR